MANVTCPFDGVVTFETSFVVLLVLKGIYPVSEFSYCFVALLAEATEVNCVAEDILLLRVKFAVEPNFMWRPKQFLRYV